MKHRIRRHPAVVDDIIGISSFIADNDIRAAMRFVDAIEKTLNWLVRYPGAARLRDFDDPRLSRVRAWPIGRYRNHLVFYEVEPDGIYILAIIHGARDLPRVLEDRVEE